jgi:hypothetical protein
MHHKVWKWIFTAMGLQFDIFTFLPTLLNPRSFRISKDDHWASLGIVSITIAKGNFEHCKKIAIQILIYARLLCTVW